MAHATDTEISDTGAESVTDGRDRPWWRDPWLWAIVGVSVVFRVPLLGQLMRQDEILTLREFAVDLPTAVSEYTVPNNHVLHTVLVWFVTVTLGSDPWMIRLPALIAGVALVVAVYWWISSAADRKSGLMAAGLVAGSSYLIEYSTIARGYTIAALAFVVMFELSRRLLDDSSPLRIWVAWIAMAIVGFATVPVFAFSFAAVLAWFLANLALDRGDAERRTTFLRLLAASVVVGLGTIGAYLPVIVVSGLDALIANPFVQSLSWGDLPDAWRGAARGTRRFVLRDDYFAYLYPMFIVIAVVLNRPIFGRLVSPAVAAAGPILVVIVRQVSPPPRVWLFAWPLALGLAAAGAVIAIERVFPRLRTVSWFMPVLAVVLAMWLAGSALRSGEIATSREGGVFHDADQAALVLADRLTHSDRVVVESHPRVVLGYYLDGAGIASHHLNRGVDGAETIYVVVYEPRAQTLDRILAEGGVGGEQFTAAELIWQTDDTQIYMMQRRVPAPQN